MPSGQMALDISRHLRVQHAGEDLRGCFHHGDGHAPVKEVLRQLQADEAAARQHGGLGVVPVNVLLDAEGVLHSAQGKQPVQSHTGEPGLGGLGSGREDQLVVASSNTSPVSRFVTETVFLSGWMAVTSWRTFMLTRKREKKLSGVWRVSSSGFSMTPPM